MKKITPQMAHDAIVKSIGKYGWYALNDYLELRNIILFGDREHGYVRDIDKMLDGETIDKALKLMDGDTIVAIRQTPVCIGRKRLPIPGWVMSILPMGAGYVSGPYTIMNRAYSDIEDCLADIKKFSDDIYNTSRDVYVTGDSEGVAKVTEAFDWIGKTIAPNCYTFNV